jgi:translation initiation factor IF-2
MTDKKEEKESKLTLRKPGRLELKKTVGAGQVSQSFSHGRTKKVTVEVKRKRTFEPGAGGKMTAVDRPGTRGEDPCAQGGRSGRREASAGRNPE